LYLLEIKRSFCETNRTTGFESADGYGTRAKSESLIHYAGFCRGRCQRTRLFREGRLSLLSQHFTRPKVNPSTVIESSRFRIAGGRNALAGDFQTLSPGPKARLIDDQNANAIANALEEFN